MRRWLSLIARIIVAGLAFWFIYRRLDVSQLRVLIHTFNLRVFGLMFVVYSFLIFLSAYRWYLLMRCKGLNIHLRKAVEFYFIGLFFNNFLPTSIGGDTVRAIYTGEYTNHRTEAWGSVLLERSLAFLGLGTVSLMGALLYKPEVRFFHVIAGFLVFILAIFVLLFLPPIRKVMNRILPRLKFRGLGDKLLFFYDRLHEYRGYPGTLVTVYFISIFVQLCIAWINFVLGNNLGIPAPFTQYMLNIPLVQIVSMLPVSINALGIREGSYIGLFPYDKEALWLLSYSVFFIGLSVSLLGIIPFMRVRQLHRKT